MLSVYQDNTTGQQWPTFYEYDGQGRLILTADPSAVSGYNDTYADLLHSQSGNYQYLNDSTGLLTIYDYASSTTATTSTAGDVANYLKDTKIALANIKVEVELGFDPKLAFAEAQRCLNCDVQTVFTDKLCIECDACVDICPMDCITFTENGEEADLRQRLTAPSLHPEQDLYIADGLKTGRIMAKDEDVCLHCSLCAERCPTGAWDMQKFLIEMTHAGPGCRKPQRKAA